MTIKGVKTKEGQYIQSKRYIVTTGTFLRGMIHIGKTKYPAGRHLRDSSNT